MDINTDTIEKEKICEIAFIFGQLTEQKRIKFEPIDLEEAYEHFEEIYKSWLQNKDTISEAENAYITEYANRIILERYKN